MSSYQKIFDPPLSPPVEPQGHVADRASATAYVYDDDLVLAVNVALATGRPLLLRGRPGTGKSSMARNVALHLGRRFYPTTLSSRTQARDLLWTVDDVARLSDAAMGRAAARSRYVVPGPLWWAFDPATAARRGLPDGELRHDELLPDPNEGETGADAAVVLLDEIDKVDPDVPNDLLETLGLYRFRTERGDMVAAPDRFAPLVVLTTNEERDLPKAFLRRCVVHVLPLPTRERLLTIAAVRLGDQDEALYDDVVRTLAPGGDDVHVDISIAEFLDAVAAARRLEIGPSDDRWPQLLAATTSKPPTIDVP
jgi:MoxR-like ATPase